MIHADTLKRCAQRFEEEPGILAAWGLGSAFNGRLRADSDVDIAVLYERSYREDVVRSGRLLLDLETLFGRTVDLGQLSTRNLVYAFQALSRGELLFSRDPAVTDQFVGRILSLYADFKVDRRVVEDAYRA